MKMRMLDLLQCSCGGESLSLQARSVRKVEHHAEMKRVRCQRICGFKHCGVGEGKISPGDCTECYSHEVVEGTLTCGCGREYEIADGIPRFLPNYMENAYKRIQKTFTYEWKMFRFGERNWGQDITYRRSLFLQGMGVKPEVLEDRLLLDAGCGSGVLSIDLSKSFGMEVIALDLASGIEKAYQQNDSPFVHFIQGSVLDLPVRKESCDYVYCAGVLVALPDTYTGFKAVIKPLKRKGRCFIWVYHPIDDKYHPGDRMKLATYNWIRRNITSPLPIRMQFIAYLMCMPVFLIKQKTECMFMGRSAKLTWREKMQALFDMFSPIYQNRHTHEEVTEWFEKEGFRNVNISDKGLYGFGTHGDKA